MTIERAALPQLVATDKYVGVLDLLGWSAKVVADFEGTSELYDGLMHLWSDLASDYAAEVSIRAFSDSILIVSDSLGPVLGAANTLQFTALHNDCLLRGGIAFGKHAERGADFQLHVVSVPLVLAARLEKSIGIPAVGIDASALPEGDLSTMATLPAFQRSMLYFEGRWVVNPFNLMWGLSAANRVRQLRDEHPEHAAKYDWFLRLYEAVASAAPLVP